MYYLLVGIFIPILLIGQKDLGIFPKVIVTIYILIMLVVGLVFL